MSSHAARARALPALALRPFALPRVTADGALAIGLGAILAGVAFAAQGGLLIGRTTKVELVLLLGSGLVVAGATLAAPARGRLFGGPALALFGLLALWTVASIAWAANPSDAWEEANRTITYVALFAAALAAARAAPQRWPALLGGIVLGALVVTGYALVTKVFAGALNPDEVYARLRAPYGYWNSVGLTAALAVPPLLWLGARRHGHAAINVLAYPVLGVALVALLLAYSRGALLAMAIGCAFWFAAVPLRLRGAAVLGTTGAAALLVSGWAFSQDALSKDRIPLVERVAAGHRLGLLLVAMVLVLLVAGLVAGFTSDSRPPRELQRRRAGAALLCAVALVPIGVAVGLAQTQRGFTGSISHGFHELTDPNAASPSNAPDRLTSVGSVRSRYWSEALRMWRDHEVIGVGAGGYATVRPRYRRDTLDVRHAHGYAVQTLADLGIVGAIISLAALLGWAWSAARATGLRRRDRGRPYGPERVGLLTMTAVAIVFGVHSFVDWTWFVPGNAVVALLCAGWVAGRGPLRDATEAAPVPLRSPRAWLADRWHLAAALGVVAVALIAAWAVWQPLRSVDASNDGFDALARGNLAAARGDALAAQARNPLALDPLTELALVQQRSGHRLDALRTLRRAVRLQPANAASWEALGDFELNGMHRPKRALQALSAALYLDPRNTTTIAAYLEVLRTITGKPVVAAPAPSAPATPARPPAATG